MASLLKLFSQSNQQLLFPSSVLLTRCSLPSKCGVNLSSLSNTPLAFGNIFWGTFMSNQHFQETDLFPKNLEKNKISGQNDTLLLNRVNKKYSMIAWHENKRACSVLVFI